jgi:peptidoglycan hydrolase-like protein with peptidoglycan-binding domain
MNRRTGTQTYVGGSVVTATLLAFAVSCFAAAPARAQGDSAGSQATVLSASVARGTIVSPGTGYGPVGSPLVRSVQARLAGAGYPPGPIDGRYGPLTEQAVMRYQAAHGLPVDGIAGPRTLAALTRGQMVLRAGAGYPSGSSDVRHLQRLLAKSGISPGPIDGFFGPLTALAVSRSQATHGLPDHGVAGPRTLAALGWRGEAPRPTQTPAASSAPAPTSSAPAAPAAPAPPAGTAPGPAAHGPTPSGTTRHTGHTTQTGWIVVLWLLAAVLLAAALGMLLYERRRSAGGLPGRRTSRAERGAPAAGAGARPPKQRPDAAERATVAAPEPQAAGKRDAAPKRDPTAEREAALKRDAAPNRDSTPKREEAGERAVADQPARPAARVNGDARVRADPPPVPSARANGHHSRARAPREPEAQPMGIDSLFKLGLQLEQSDDPAGAEAAYRRADERGHAAAASNLGVLLQQRGDATGAEAAYERADQRGDANGAFNLAVLREATEDLAGAEAAYRRADERGHPAAASNLGVLLEQRGDRTGAKAAYRRADRRGEASGTFNLAVLLEEAGDLPAAEAAYRRAESSGDDRVAGPARDALADLVAGAAASGPADGAMRGT